MTTVDVSPDGLREAGRILNEARETLVTGSNAHLLHGLGDDQHISTGGFPTGAFAQQQLGILYGQAQQTLHNVVNNFVAVSSGLHIVADLFESTDQEEALRFAFMDPGAAIPVGLPAYIDPEVNSEQLREQAEMEQALNGGALPDGWTRVDRETSPYTKVTEILDADGAVVGSMYTTTTAGRRSVTYYDADRQAVSTRVEVTSADGSQVVQTYNGRASDGELVREQHQAVGADGSTNYHTDVYEDGERVDTVDQVTVAPEPEQAMHGEGLGRGLGEAEYLAEAEMMFEHATEYGPARPEDYSGEHNQIRAN